MSIPTQKSPDHQQPRWLSRTAAWGSAIVYACIFAAANIGPRPGIQAHGWPFVYMVRETNIPGDLHNVLYGPWPLFSPSPPLVSFEPMRLVLDVLCGIALTCLAPILCLYWLRVRRRPFQFSLRSLFVLTTTAACLLGVLKFFDPDFGHGWRWPLIAWFTMVFAQLFFVYIVPVACVATVARWAVLRFALSQWRRPWCGIHWLSWLAVVVVGVPVIHYSAFPHWAHRGWPFTYYLGRFDVVGLMADIAISLTIIVAAAVVVEYWTRKIEQGTPIRLAPFLAAAVVGNVICVFTLNAWELPEWYDYLSWLFGIACAAFAVEMAILRGAGWLFRKF